MKKTANKNGLSKKKLPGGVTVVCEHLPGLQTASVGFWLPRGSRDETPSTLGGYHFIEHMLFKGTASRSAREIAVETESVGGNMNAMTGKEYTCYYAKSLSEDLPLMVEILADMFFNSTFDKEEFDREKQVVLEEISNLVDSPEDFIFDQYLEDSYGPGGIGHCVLGYERTIEPMSRDRLFRMYRERYVPNELIVAIAGNMNGLDPAKLVAETLDRVLGRQWRRASAAPVARKAAPNGGPKFRKGVRAYGRDIEQSYFVVGMPGFSYSHDDRYILSIIDVILSGGMSSRLFQEVREKRGLVYDIFTATEFYKDAGVFTVCAGTRPQNLKEVLEITASEIRKVRDGDVTEEELARVRRQLRAGIAMSLENPTGRMMKIARSQIYFGRDIGDKETLRKIESVTMDDVRRVLGGMMDKGAFSASLLGPYRTSPQRKKIEKLVNGIFGRG